MKTVKFLTMAAIAAATVMTSCSSDEAIDNSPVAIRLSSGVQGEPVTRAAFTEADTQIPDGQTVAVYVDEAGGTPQLYGNNVLNANGSGGLSGGAVMYFPQTGANVDIYALHTNATLNGTFPTTLTHTVATDQSTLAGYAPSDLLYAKTTNVAKTASAVQLTFYHLLSKIEIAVVAGTGTPTITGISIGGTKLEAGFTLVKANAPNAVAITANGAATAIAIDKQISSDFNAGVVYNAAVIVPQTVAANTDFIIVHLQSGGDLIYKLPSNMTFEGGNRYIYNITANLTGLTLSSTISNWLPVNPDPTTGEAK